MRGHPIFATFKGQRLSVPEIVKATGLSTCTIIKRIKDGTPLDAPRQTTRGKAKLRLEFRGRLATVDEIAQETGLSIRCVYMRHDGKTFYEPTPKEPMQLTFDGVTDTTAGWAKRTGLSQGVILHRIRSGWTVDKVLSTSLVKRQHQITFAGETLTIAQWAKRTGINKLTLYERIVYNRWPIARALTEPVFTRGEQCLKRKRLRRMVEGFATHSDARHSLPADPLRASPSLSPGG